MKLSDYVFKFLENYVDTVFLLSGGGIMHLVDSLGRSKMKAVCCHHEQAVAIAAEGYARIRNDIGVALVTTGPGGTNALTGIAGAWLDSIPTLTIAGQVKTADITPRKNGVPVVRAMGFQELNVTDMAKPVVKYAVTIEEPKTIRYHLEKAIYLATSGRPGPVWIEIPLDIQAMEVNPKKLRSFKKPTKTAVIPQDKIKIVARKLREARKPLILVGNGIRMAGAEKQLSQLLEKTKINAITSIFTADDLVTYEYPFYLGRQGMPGNESANWALDNCDLLLIVGERMQLTQISYDNKNFGRNTFKIMVDIDKNELKKKRLKIDLPLCLDAKVFLNALLKQDLKLRRWSVEVKNINWKDFNNDKAYINVYRFLEELNKYVGGVDIATANGMASLTSHQALKVKKGNRFITNAGLGHMGSGLPLAIGASLANRKKTVWCMEGDGSLMLNIHELQTVVYHNLPVKIFIFNNGGYFSIRSTHLNYFKKIFAADESSGLSLPNYSKLIPAWGLKYVKISSERDFRKLKKLENKGPMVIEVMIDPYQQTLPKWSAGQLKDRISVSSNEKS